MKLTSFFLFAFFVCFLALAINANNIHQQQLSKNNVNDGSEYGFLGFGYSIGGCPDSGTLNNDFSNMKNFGAQMVRLYDYCDNDGYNSMLISAASQNGLKIIPLIWFPLNDYDWEPSDSPWRQRLSDLVNELTNNPLAPSSVKSVALGSEVFLDGFIDPSTWLDAFNSMKGSLAPTGIEGSVSEMQWSFTGLMSQSDQQNIFNALDLVQANILTYFSNNATTANASWTDFDNQLNWFMQQANGKQIIITETGWPNGESESPPNSGNVVANKQNQQDYWDHFNNNCNYFKQNNVGWFFYLWQDSEWGYLDWNGNPNINFSPNFC